VPHTGRKVLEHLLAAFGSPQGILEASAERLLAAVPTMSVETAKALLEVDLRKTEDELACFQDEGIQVMTWLDADYPVNLSAAPDRPAILMVKGRIVKADEASVAIVGATHPTVAGISEASHLARGLGWRGLTIVSGLAEGIDTAAHFGALEVGARTIAVLGSGLREVFPPKNQPLAQNVINFGALVSEVHPDAKVSPQRLMARNRITSGLAKATVVVESETDSGSLATADRAWRQGRLVYAVDNGKKGNTELLAGGARLIAPGEKADIKELAEEIRRHEVPKHVHDDGQLSFDF
jgi:DNA processing protein